MKVYYEYTAIDPSAIGAKKYRVWRELNPRRCAPETHALIH